jgi:hypothetical protein
VTQSFTRDTIEASSLGGAMIALGAGATAFFTATATMLQHWSSAIDTLLYVPPQITGFSNTVGTVEIGSTITALTLAWSFNKAMVSVTLNGAALPPAQLSERLTGLALVANTTYTLTASDGTRSTAQSSTIGFLPRRWWGVSALPALGSDDILALGNSDFATSRGQARSMSAAGEYLYFAWPASFGMPSFTVNGLQSSGWVEAAVSHTNAAGFTQPYYTFRSQYAQNGSGILVVVS